MIVLLSDERPVARKPHHCDACGGTIGAGDRYLRQRCIDDDPYVFKCHSLCDAAYWVAHRELGCFDYEEGVEQDEVRPVVLRFFEFLAGLP